MAGPNGWDGSSVQRWLRVVTLVVCLGVFVFLSVSPDLRGADGVVVAFSALGAVLVLLGYERLIRLPVIGRGKEEEDEDGPSRG